LSFGDEIADLYAGTAFKEGKHCRELLLEVALGGTGTGTGSGLFPSIAREGIASMLNSGTELQMISTICQGAQRLGFCLSRAGDTGFLQAE
jgi:hypothetical protein